MFDDRLGGAERVRPDSEHHGVASSHDPGGVGEHVGSTFEHEPDHPERCPAGLDRPPLMIDLTFQDVARRRTGSPTAQSGYHAGPHRVAQLQPRGRPAAGTGSLDIGSIRRRDRSELAVVRETVGEPGEEGGDLIVRTATQQSECSDRGVDGIGRDRVGGGRNVQQRSRVRIDDQSVTRRERPGQLARHLAHAIACVHDLLTDREGGQPAGGR